MRDLTAGLCLVLTAAVIPGCSAPRHSLAPANAPGPTAAAAAIFEPIDWPTPSDVRTADGRPGPAYWQQQADFVIDATLDPASRTLSATGTLIYTNNSPLTLPFLWLHLEQNLFTEDSIGALTTPPNARFGNPTLHAGGKQTFAVTLADGSSPPVRIYDTLARIDLPAALAPGSSVTLSMRWSFTIPTYGSDRMGVDEKLEQGEVFQIAQWFPTPAVYDDVRGWNTLPYTGQGEFYTNFGSYTVRITVPRDMIVAATGELQNPEAVLTPVQLERFTRARTSTDTVVIRSADEVTDPASRPAGEGPITWTFAADNVRTFAFAASRAFIWDAAAISSSDNGGQGVLVQSVYPKEALPLWGPEHAAGGSTQMVAHAIRHYAGMWHHYPYPSAVNVNGIVGGMEYPQIVFCRARTDERALFGVTTHEIAHNWFPMVVNTDERRYAWLDEGLSTFVNIYSNQARWPDWQEGERSDARAFVGRMLEPDQQPIMTTADLVRRDRLGILQYGKPAVGLRILREQILGPDRFDPAFRQYIADWAFKSPQPADFFRSIENGAGADLAWFWRGWFMTTATLDQAVTGFTQDPDDSQVRVSFENRGEMVMPLVFTLTYADGSSSEHRLPAETWRVTSRWEARVATQGKRVVQIAIDADERFPDTDRSNNVLRR